MRRFLRWLFGPPPGYTVSVSRPTTADGEQVQLTTTARVGASAKEIAGILDTCSLAIQFRMSQQNELVMRVNANVAHDKWLKTKAKLDDAEKLGRHGAGVLTKEERRWWMTHSRNFDKDGPIVASEEKVAAAAEP